jgi:hypothetical protein
MHEDHINLAIGLCPVKHLLKLGSLDGSSGLTLFFVDTIRSESPVMIHAVLLACFHLRWNTQFSFGLTRGRDSAVD